MQLLETYIARNKDSVWFEQFSSLAKENYGRLFEYTNTNFRYQSSFFSQFKTFEEVEGKERSTWETVASGQEKHKQHVINMLASKLFRRDPKGGEEEKNYIYRKTEKGKLYKTFLEDKRFSDNEKWILNYIFLLNGYYTGQRGYIIKRTVWLAEIFTSLGVERKDLAKRVAEAIGQSYTLQELLRKDFFYLHSFFADAEFLELYLHSSSEEREELALYIESNHLISRTKTMRAAFLKSIGLQEISLVPCSWMNQKSSSSLSYLLKERNLILNR